ncbi:AsmA-like C-terminal region-containing protein [Paralimibaculum aggregatum]|uniref:AsmA-like C-terminal region-containing protein n=1 Tax=Paralimibaculum aggregatum TaxID=3036245 RepID=A0ABQ6LRA2_9RHOB|nr:AsmA-like C-terminal domain-containing protein [Limibaculum sp. NKW23]GMG84463.1 AsmA-like C-terminal region-containing protein [Limibaculum sp. NKW23]
MGFGGETVSRTGGVYGACRRGVRLCLKVVAGLAALVVIATVTLYLRLMQGPLAIDPVAHLTAAYVNASIDTARIEIGGASLRLGSRGAPSGIEFGGVRVHAPDGTVLLSAPRLAAGFHLADLVQGKLQPTRMVLSGARARVLRDRDGRIRFGLGSGPGVLIDDAVAGAAAETGPEAAIEELLAAEPAGADAVARIIRGFVGDIEPVPILSRLNYVAVLQADLIYQDALSGKVWRTSGSDLEIFQTAYGARAKMRAAVTERTDAPTRLRVTATRKAGTGLTEFAIGFDGLQPNHLAVQASSLSWAGLIEAPLDGRMRLSIQPDGTLGPAEGSISARNGRLLGVPRHAQPFRLARIGFRAEKGFRTLAFTGIEIDGDALQAKLTGEVLVQGPDPLSAEAVAAQIYVERLAADLPGLFPEPVAFDGGQALARVQLEPLQIELANLHLTDGDLTLAAAGRAALEGEDWHLRMRATGQNVSVPDLKRLWPIGTGGNARIWVMENIISGRVPELVAQFDMLGETPQFALDFRFEEVTSRYLGEMQPIEDAWGTGHLGLSRFDLALERGEVRMPGHAALDIAGSQLTFSDILGDAPPADIRVVADGPVGAVLDLIDEPPLGLIAKLGLDLGDPDGRAEVTARLGLPLLSSLKVEDVKVASEARLSDLALALDLGGGGLDVTAQALELTASDSRLDLSGQVTADGVPLRIAWAERYGAEPGRDLQLAGALTPKLLRARGLSVPGFTGGNAPAEVVLSGVGDAMRLTATLDLGPAALDIAPLRWSKPAGRPGRLEIAGRLGAATDIERVVLSAPGLDLAGSARLGPAGRLAEARIDRLAMGERFDIAGRVTRTPEGVYDITVEGPRLDLSDFIDDPADTDSSGQVALRLDARIGRLDLTPTLYVAPAAVVLSQTEAGRIVLELSGEAAGRSRFHARYARRAGEPGTVRMTSDDTGGLLSALGLFQGGSGGSLILDAVFKPAEDMDLRGEAEIRNMRVQRAATFGEILVEGGAAEAAEAVESGLVFDTINIPFSYTDGVIALEPSIARSPALALKVEGEVQEAEGRLDLHGVISPAYALTGVLDEIPVLGTLLSGGEGEGILAMTFQVFGSLDDPSVEVNPLSVLMPGILRGVFSRKAAKPRQDFLDQLGPTE